MNLLSDLKKIAVKYVGENSEAYLNRPVNAELRNRLANKSTSFNDYIENKIKMRDMGADDYVPIMHFLFENNQALQGTLLDADVAENYMYLAITDRIDKNEEKIPDENEFKKRNWADISSILQQIKYGEL